jgi:hypothetical protein
LWPLKCSSRNSKARPLAITTYRAEVTPFCAFYVPLGGILLPN